MADKSNKNEWNVDGKYYIDEECIACGVCIAEAQNNILMTDDDSAAFISKQPENDQEITELENARESCPVDAIGNDGE